MNYLSELSGKSPEERMAVMEKYRKQEQAEYEQEYARLREKWEHEAQMRQLLQRKIHDNPHLFLDTEGLYRYDPDGAISSQELYQLYRNWCIAEHIPLSTPRAFWLAMKKLGPEYAMTYCTLTGPDGKRCRGFRGIRATENNSGVTHN